jgi:hypothetical protein
MLHETLDTQLHFNSTYHPHTDGVTPTFFSRIKFCANRSAYKNAYQIIVYMKTFQKNKNKSCIGCIAWHGILYFSKILEEPRRI